LHSTTAEGATKPPLLRELMGVSEAVLQLLGPFIPDFELVLEDVDHLSLAQIRERRLPPEVELMLFLFKRARRSAALLEELRAMASVLRALGSDRLGVATVVSYILEVREETDDEVQEFFREQLGPVGVEGFMTGAERLTEKVRRASEAKAKAESILRVLERRGVMVTEPQRALVLRTNDVAVLDDWLDRAIVVERAEDVFS
jgi:hypothetical protein